jgi:16S rRNA G966 N2-methylase RsmD
MIRHWKTKLGSYEDLENEEATWFIDPPYQFGGHEYKHSNKQIDFNKLGEWCKNRNGQIIVCENTKADWLPFKPMIDMQGARFKTTEAIWSNHKTNYDAVQQSLQF